MAKAPAKKKAGSRKRQPTPGSFKKGQSGNPSGLSTEKRELIQEVRAMLTKGKNLEEACAILLRQMRSDDERVSMTAVKEYFDRVLGKAPIAITGEGGGALRLDLSGLSDEDLRLVLPVLNVSTTSTT